MSYSDDETKYAPQNVAIKTYRYGGKVKVKISFEVEEDCKHFDKDEMQARMNRAAPWMLEHLYSWADFDHFFSVNLFVDALYNLGKGLLRWDNCKTSVKNGRRCLAAAGMLKKAYTTAIWDDKSYRNWINNRRISWKTLPGTGGMSQMITKHLKENAMDMDKKEYSDKMWRLINDRHKKIEGERKAEAWAFIHKYIEHFWD